MIRHPHLAARIFNTPLLIHPAKLDAIVYGLGPRFGLDDPPQSDAYLTPSPKREPGGYRIVDGIAVIDVFGVLAHRTRMEADSSWIQGYDGLARQFAAALADPQAKAILLNIDSPGGEVAGAFQLADQIRAARGVKPIHAIAGDLAASAAYLIASAADTLSVTRTGEVGSIGVVMCHVDFSGALAQEGIRVTSIYAGAHKVDGNPYQPLPAGVQADLQAQVDHYYGLFVDAVVASRKGVTPESIRATEARVFTAEQAVHMGLADMIVSPDQHTAQISQQVSQSTFPRAIARQPGGRPMADNQGAADPITTATFTQSDFDAAREAGRQAGLSEGRATERKRLKSILSLPQAEGREALARKLATTTDLSAEAVAPLLDASPVAIAATPEATTDFAEHMARIGNPAVGPDQPPVNQQANTASMLESAWADARARAGY
ncbi:MAG: S49 family peptidase [Candidatus Competibacteraceae bacterium]|nr:S49 family peptidase [Candidatus Competibacteraceae bacterium]